MHKTVELPILYFGTPVAIISTMNEDGSPNLAPISSAWWLGQSCMLGLGAASKTSENLLRERECVINLPSAGQVTHVDRLALTTGRDPVPEYKAKMGYEYVPDKFEIAGLTPMKSDLVAPPRVKECPVQMEGTIYQVHRFGKQVTANAFEVHIERVHIDDDLLFDTDEARVDALRWNPLIMSFREFFGIGRQVHPSRLASFPESMFRKPKSDMGAPSCSPAIGETVG
jgi:flavin reductase (DIM6/NTAB) family NADH-FMN oxidoreductase RutF